MLPGFLGSIQLFVEHFLKYPWRGAGRWFLVAAGLLSADVPTADLSHRRAQPQERVSEKRIGSVHISYFPLKKKKPLRTQARGLRGKNFRSDRSSLRGFALHHYWLVQKFLTHFFTVTLDQKPQPSIIYFLYTYFFCILGGKAAWAKKKILKFCWTN